MGKIDTAISVGNYTKAGVFGILSSRFASRQYPDAFKINEVLKKQGYVCRVIASGDQTEFYDMTPYYGHDFDLISDGRLPSEFSINDDERIISTLKSLPERGATPGFFYIHLMSVHHLGYVREEFNKWKTANPTRSETKRDNSDNGILQADDIIRRSIEILKNKGYLSDYLLFITSDHGEGHGEHNHFNHSIFLYSEDISIPLLWKDSKLETTPSYSFATQVDIAPTILGQLGLPIPAGWDGIHFSATPRPLFYVSSPYRNGWRAVINPSKNKEIYLYLQHEKDRVSEQLYSLADDPRELHDLIGHISPEQLSTWRAAGDSFLNE